MEKIKLLYIEDDDGQRKALATQLRAKGFDVTVAKSGRSGLSLFSKRSFTAILCDLNMPGMGGDEVLEQVRKKDRSIPFILLSAHGTVSLAVKAIKRGANHFILKPPEIDKIDITIRQALETRRLREKLEDSEATLRLVTENVPDIIYSLNAKGEFLSLSGSVEGSLGYKPVELLGTSVFTLIHPEDRPVIRKGIEKSIKEKDEKVKNVRFRMLSKSGAVRHYEISRKMVFENGRLVRNDGIARDVTERVELEEKLREYSQQLERMVAERTEDCEYVNRQLSSLNMVSNRFSTIFSEEQLFDEIPTLLTTSLDFDRAYLLLPRGHSLYVRSWCPGKGKREPMNAFVDLFNKGEVAIPPHLTRSFEQRETVFIPDMQKDRRWPREPAFMTRARSIVISPVKAKNEAVGIIVGSMEEHGREMIKQDVERFEMFANMSGLALDNIRAYQSMEKKVIERTESLERANAELKEKARELEENRMEIAHANIDMLAVQEKLEEKNVELEGLLKELSASKDKLQTIIDANPNLLILVDSEGIVQTVNRRIKDYFDIEPDLAVGGSYEGLIETVSERFEDPAKFVGIIEDLERKADVPGEMEITTLYGRGIRVLGDEPLMVSVTSTCVFDENGAEIGRLWGYHNIARMKEVDERVHAIVQASPIPTIISRIDDGEVLFVNEELASLIGATREELIGRRTTEFYYDPEDRLKLVESLRKDGYLRNSEIRLKRIDGTVIWSLLSLVVTQIGGEKVILGGVYDISERKRFEEELTRERNFVSAILDTAGALVIVLDTKGRVVRFNRACEEISGYTFDEVKGKKFWDIFLLPQEMGMVTTQFDKMRAGFYPLKGENYWVTKSGDRRLVAWSNTALTDDEGRVEYVIAIGIDMTEQREAEEKIKLFREFFMNANDGMAIFDADGTMIDRNPTHRRFSALSDEEIRGMTLRDLFPAYYEAMGEKIAEEGSFRGEVSWDAKGGQKAIDLSVFTIRNDVGKISYYAGIGRDITERKQAEEAIATRLRYEEGLAGLSQTLLTGEGTDVDLVRALEYLLDAARVSRVYIFENFDDPGDGLCMRQTHEVCAESVEPQIDNPLLAHAPYRMGFDRWREILGRGEPLKGLIRDFPETEQAVLLEQDIKAILVIPITVEGTWYGFIGFDDTIEEREWNNEDIRTLRTAAEIIGIYLERRRFEETLRVSEERFRSLVENANDIIYSLTPTGEFTYLSPKVNQILGYEVSELIGKPFFLLLHPDDVQTSKEWFDSGFQDDEHPGMGYEFRTFDKDGNIRWLTTRSSHILDESGAVIELIGVAHDITRLRQVLEDLEEANRHIKETQAQLVQSEKMASLGMLVAGIAHEINTPIGAVSSMHDTLMRSMDNLKNAIEEQCSPGDEIPSKIRAALQIIDDSNKVIRTGAERVINIVRRLRSFARLDEAELKTVDVHEGLEDTLTLVHHELKHDVTVVKDYGDVPPIPVFPGRLNQVFLNILVNARQAIKGKGTITITTAVKSGNVHISIKDTGVGIAREHLEKVFDPGFTTKGVGVGTGLGLSICYQIVQDHHGAITVESEIGKGTTFTIVLPLNLDKILEGNAPSI
ncbi:MAG: PAS domain S-box protein [bacterium]|nr:MAG: PAS domain S-box protein [bacterium]